MAKKKDLGLILFELVAEHSMSTVLTGLTNLLSNPNIPVTEVSVEAATFLRDTIRDTVKHRTVMQQPVFKRES